MHKLASVPRLAIMMAVISTVMAQQAAAHPIEPNLTSDAKLQSEIAASRKGFQNAATKRDAVALRSFYTDDFTHTHTSGKVDGKDARIVSVIAGEQTVEMAPVSEFRLSWFSESMCVARALSPIKRGSDGKWFDVR